MIKSLSPYYLTIPFASPLTSAISSAYTLQIFVWEGLKASVPATPIYQITKKNPTGTSGNDKINISRLVNDYIEFETVPFTVSALYNGNNQQWVKTQVIYTTEDEDDLNNAQLQTTTLMLKGYGYGLDGENSQPPTNRVLIVGDEFKVSRNGAFNLPILADESLTFPYSVESFPLGSLSFSGTIPASTLSQNLIKSIFINMQTVSTTDEYIEINFNDIITTILITDECRYSPIDIVFQNKEGALQFLTFFKAKTESIKGTSEEFEFDRGQPKDGFHQFVTYNVQGRSEFKINSGFVDESMNESYKQLILSERIWQFTTDHKYIPLSLTSQSLEYKTRAKDRLINYEFGFKYAFNDVNNI